VGADFGSGATAVARMAALWFEYNLTSREPMMCLPGLAFEPAAHLARQSLRMSDCGWLGYCDQSLVARRALATTGSLALLGSPVGEPRNLVVIKGGQSALITPFSSRVTLEPLLADSSTMMADVLPLASRGKMSTCSSWPWIFASAYQCCSAYCGSEV
jgi:hypothetical protein